MSNIEEKYQKLKDIFNKMGKALVAFSGGVDSTLLLKVAQDTLGDKNVLAVTALSSLYPEREKKEVEKLIKQLGVEHRFIESDELEIPGFSENPPDRCYYCKRQLFKELKEIARAKGLSAIIEGSTVDDEADYRPGKKAVFELGIRSPLKEALFSKEEVRALSKSLGLPNWDKPSFACLASRFPYGQRISEEALKRIDQAEDFLFRLGFKQVRVRHYGDLARIELLPEEMDRMLNFSTRKQVVDQLKKIGYRYVTLDLQGFRSGSMNEVLR
jgi:pyridinium-3,5-biscarboxylic acid mononucleotide sulfurtransferase